MSSEVTTEEKIDALPPALREIVRMAGERGYGTKAILHLAVASEIFLNK